MQRYDLELTEVMEQRALHKCRNLMIPTCLEIYLETATRRPERRRSRIRPRLQGESAWTWRTCRSRWLQSLVNAVPC